MACCSRRATAALRGGDGKGRRGTGRRLGQAHEQLERGLRGADRFQRRRRRLGTGSERAAGGCSAPLKRGGGLRPGAEGCDERLGRGIRRLIRQCGGRAGRARTGHDQVSSRIPGSGGLVRVGLLSRGVPGFGLRRRDGGNERKAEGSSGEMHDPTGEGSRAAGIPPTTALPYSARTIRKRARHTELHADVSNRGSGRALAILRPLSDRCRVTNAGVRPLNRAASDVFDVVSAPRARRSSRQARRAARGRGSRRAVSTFMTGARRCRSLDCARDDYGEDPSTSLGTTTVPIPRLRSE
jgi:hypothetical protein